MSTSTEGIPVPSWDLADRLRKCLRESDMSVQEMADYLEVSRNTVSAWINGRTPPSPQSVRLWALRTGMSYDWLRNGGESIEGPPRPPRNGASSSEGTEWAASKPVGYLPPMRIPAQIIELPLTG